MKYRIFDTEAEAIAAEAQVAADIGCVKTGINAKTGLPAPEAQATTRWAIKLSPILHRAGTESHFLEQEQSYALAIVN